MNKKIKGILIIMTLLMSLIYFSGCEDKHEHTLVLFEKKDATCLTEGNIEYYKCSECDKIFSDSLGVNEISEVIIPKTLHNLKKNEAKEATCIKEGYQEYYECRSCKKLFSDSLGMNEINSKVTISKISHNIKKIEAKEATCSEEGHSEYYECSICNKLFSDENQEKELKKSDVIIPKKDHIFTEYKSEDLNEWYQCSICSEIDQSTLKRIELFVRSDLVQGQKIFFGVGFNNITLKVDDESIIKILSFEDNLATQVCYYRFYGLKEGTTYISYVSNETNKIIAKHKCVVKNEDTVHISEGSLVDSINIDNTEAIIYTDQTEVTYTIVTSKDVDRIELAQLYHKFSAHLYNEIIGDDVDGNDRIIELDKIVIDKSVLNGKKQVNEKLNTSFSATRSESQDKATWVIKWDLGYTAVKFVRIKAVASLSNNYQTCYVKLNIDYPKIDLGEDGYIELIKKFVEYNLTTPYLFRYDIDDDPSSPYLVEGDVMPLYSEEYSKFKYLKATPYEESFENSLFFGGTSVLYLANYAWIIPYVTDEYYETLSYMFNGKKVLFDFYFYSSGTVGGFYYPISNELRALVAYKYGYEIDKELFPIAYSILEKGSKVVKEIITDDMTDFEKEKAIYDWLNKLGVEAMTNKYLPIPSGMEENLVYKTAYGIFNNYGGDCMGWSSAFYVLCQMAGLECMVFDCRTDTGGPVDKLEYNHRCNVIKLDDEYYFVDTFWSVTPSFIEAGTVYAFMNMNTDDAIKNYQWKKEFGPLHYDYKTYLVDDKTGELLNK